MPIAFVSYNGLNCPVFLCDVCGKSFPNPRMGLVVWDGGDLLFTHKGACVDSIGRPENSRALVDFVDQLGRNTLHPLPAAEKAKGA